VSNGGDADARGSRVQQLEQSLALCERDRALIAYELHDGLAQQLAAASMHIDAAAAQIKSDPDEAIAMLKTASDRLRDAQEEMRRLMRGIRPPRLDADGLSAAITELVEELKLQGMEIQLTLNITTPRLLPALETAAFRILQEALNNVLRHSGAQQAEVVVEEHDSHLKIVVTDHGRGFDPATIPTSRYGVRGIHERAELLGGSAIITTQPGAGTRVVVQLPLSDPLLDTEI